MISAKLLNEILEEMRPRKIMNDKNDKNVT